MKGLIFKLLGGAVLLFFAWLAWGWYSIFGQKSFAGASLGEFCGPAYAAAGFELGYSDKLEKGGKMNSWMDSSVFCRLQTSPARALAFKEKLRAGHVPDPDRPPPAPGEDIFSCEFDNYGKEPRPKWWQGGGSPGASCYTVHESTTHPRGVNLVIFESEGLIFAERWHT